MVLPAATMPNKGIRVGVDDSVRAGGFGRVVGFGGSNVRRSDSRSVGLTGARLTAPSPFGVPRRIGAPGFGGPFLAAGSVIGEFISNRLVCERVFRSRYQRGHVADTSPARRIRKG